MSWITTGTAIASAGLAADIAENLTSAGGEFIRMTSCKLCSIEPVVEVATSESLICYGPAKPHVVALVLQGAYPISRGHGVTANDRCGPRQPTAAPWGSVPGLHQIAEHVRSPFGQSKFYLHGRIRRQREVRRLPAKGRRSRVITTNPPRQRVKTVNPSTSIRPSEWQGAYQPKAKRAQRIASPVIDAAQSP